MEYLHHLFCSCQVQRIARWTRLQQSRSCFFERATRNFAVPLCLQYAIAPSEQQETSERIQLERKTRSKFELKRLVLAADTNLIRKSRTWLVAILARRRLDFSLIESTFP